MMGKLYVLLIDHSILQRRIHTLMPKKLLNLLDSHTFIDGYAQ